MSAASVLRFTSKRRSLVAPLIGSYRNHYQHRSLSVLVASTSNGHNDSHSNNQYRFQYSYQTLAAIAAGGSAAALLSTSSSAVASCEKKKVEAPPVGDPFPLQPPKNKEVVGPKGIPSRAEQIRRLKSSSKQSDPSSDQYDVLVIGGGATGAGIAFDAATRSNLPSGLKVACIERGDFASETSSRSTKLIWAGIKYLASASAALLSWDLLTSPVTTVKDFYSEFSMVFNCHQERKYMLDKQQHLTNWVPIVCPFTEWNIWPPPFGHPIFSFFPVLAPAVFKFYDALSQFTCPPSYIMTKKEARTKFPQLSDQDIKYCAVFYEGQHNDARTNIAIALSAAEKGAHIANYVEMTDGIFDEDSGKVIGVKAQDRISGETFEIYAKNIIFAGGPFTDKLRSKEEKDGGTVPPAVQGASGSHIVLPGYFAPKDMGLLDYNTSDGRFLFFLPWQGSVIVGTTDKKCDAETLPYPPEEEIQWMMKEVEKYLSNDLKVRRSDVLSAWRGWRPLAADPHAPPGSQVSRDHVISKNPSSGVTFIAGGKWTTWREMAEDVLDKVLGDKAGTCNTLDIKLHGGEGYHKSLSTQLIQKYGVSEEVANHLVKTYGGRVWEVVEKCKPTGKQWPRYGVQLVEGYPYIEAEIRFACQEYACTIEDVLSRRTRLAFLNSEAAQEALPRVADIMAEELGWNKATKKEQIKCAQKYLAAYGGRIPYEDGVALRFLAHEDAMDMFREIDRDGSGFIDPQELKEIATRLGNPLDDKQLKELFRTIDTDKNGKISADEFVAWINAEQSKNDVKRYLHATATVIFEEIDTDQSGFLDKAELKAVTVRLGEDFTDKEIKKIFKEMDTDKDGKISLQEFIAWMDKENDKTGFRKLLASHMQDNNMQGAWLDEKTPKGVTIKRKYTNSGSFLG
mmetsp:Transcript_12491/g.18675  ORF Transcript_12491/g.18675 Transcript_12491/m.18675 type:complete len:907 (-) Transcript_12491:83-2803(-)